MRAHLAIAIINLLAIIVVVLDVFVWRPVM